MIKITILAVGKIKEKYLSKGIAEYEKRLKNYCKLQIIEVPDMPIKKTRLSSAESSHIKDKEYERISKHIKKEQYVIALDIEGKRFSSEELANHINGLAIKGVSNVVFVIGGSIGLSRKLLDKADLRLSFSTFTFPHQLVRLILTEQIYRSFKIISGETYHK